MKRILCVFQLERFWDVCRTFLFRQAELREVTIIFQPVKEWFVHLDLTLILDIDNIFKALLTGLTLFFK